MMFSGRTGENSPDAARATAKAGAILVLTLLGMAGITPEMTIKDAVTLVVTSGVVWLVPNKPAV